MYIYDENLFRERWLGPPGVPRLQYIAVKHTVGSGHQLNFFLDGETQSSFWITPCPRHWNSFGKHKDPDHGFRTIPFCQLLKLVCSQAGYIVLKEGGTATLDLA